MRSAGIRGDVGEPRMYKRAVIKFETNWKSGVLGKGRLIRVIRITYFAASVFERQSH